MSCLMRATDSLSSGRTRYSVLMASGALWDGDGEEILRDVLLAIGQGARPCSAILALLYCQYLYRQCSTKGTLTATNRVRLNGYLQQYCAAINTINWAGLPRKEEHISIWRGCPRKQDNWQRARKGSCAVSSMRGWLAPTTNKDLHTVPQDMKSMSAGMHTTAMRFQVHVDSSSRASSLQQEKITDGKNQGIFKRFICTAALLVCCDVWRTSTASGWFCAKDKQR